MCVFLEPWGFLLSSVGSRPLCVISPEVALGRLAVVPGSSDSASLRGEELVKDLWGFPAARGPGPHSAEEPA